jgi:hypothetical protein
MGCRVGAGRGILDGDVVRHRFAGDPVVPVDPVGEIQQLATLAAERPICRLDWMSTTVYTEWRRGRRISHDEKYMFVDGA